VYLWVVAWLVLVVTAAVVVLGWTPVVVTSGSMAPAIQPGDVVLLDHGDTGAFEPGTVVTFHDPVREHTLLTHRIVAVEPDGHYRTRGDANAVADSVPIAPDVVVGRGRLLVPLLGLPTVWLRSDPLLLVGWIVVSVLAGASVASLSRPLRERRDGGGS
jgi:signal peptidase I